MAGAGDTSVAPWPPYSGRQILFARGLGVANPLRR